MGRRARLKWLRRAELYERILIKGSAEAAKAYPETYEKKLDKLVKGAQDLELERDIAADEARLHDPS